jgi:hypothetical protein
VLATPLYLEVSVPCQEGERSILAIELKLDKNIYEHKALVHIFPLEIGGIVGRNRSCFLRIRKPTASYKKIY